MVLGAGASYDVWDGVTPERDNRWRPPLARQLFDFGRKRHYHREIADRYPGVRRLAAELGKFSQGEVVDLEAKLRELAQHRDEKVRRWFRDIPPYLRDLVERCGREYVWDAGHYDLLLKRIVLDTNHHVGFIVMNYDTLLERSLTSCFERTFQSFESYPRDDGRIGPVVKPHGSVNWFVLIGERGKGETWRDRVNAIGDPHNVTIDWDLNEANYFTAAISGVEAPTTEIELNGHYVYPLLTAPMAGKAPQHRVCPGSHVSALKKFCQGCRKLLVIGSSGIDDNLRGMLWDSLIRGGIAHYVGVGDVGEVVARFRANGVLATSEAIGFGDGFGKYLASEEFEKFLGWAEGP